MNDDQYKHFKTSKKYPAFFIETAFGEKVWPHHKKILDSVRDHDETTVRGCHGLGKSWVGSRLPPWFMQHFTDVLVITTAPTKKQVESIIWREIALCMGKWKLPIPHGMKVAATSLKMKKNGDNSNGNEAHGFTARDTNQDAFVGFHALNFLIIVDEAAGVSDVLYEAIESLASTGNAKILLIGNPTNPQGFFKESHGPKSPANKIKISAFDTPNFTEFGITLDDVRDEKNRAALKLKGRLPAWEEKIGDSPLPAPYLVTPKWVVKMINKYGVDSAYVQTRIMAEFPVASKDSLFPMHLIEEAINFEAEDAASEYPSVLGLDVARYGGDSSKLYHRTGDKYRLVDQWVKANTTETAGRALASLRETGAQWIGIDVIGVGGGATDILADDEHPAYGVNVAMQPHDTERFANLKAELHWELKEALERGEVDLDPNDDDLHVQMSRIKFKYDKKGKIIVESKDEYKARFGDSPDNLDALLLTRADIFEKSANVTIV